MTEVEPNSAPRLKIPGLVIIKTLPSGSKAVVAGTIALVLERSIT